MEELELGVEGFEVGGYHSELAGSGITIVFPPEGNVAGVAQLGGSPGTRETDLLRPMHRSNNPVDAVAVCGRSVFGFRAVEGVVERLRLEGRGYKLGGVVVPIVPAAVIFDFRGDESDGVLPDEGWGHRAFEARSTRVRVGRVWAGRGATVGKLAGREHATPAGQGYSLFERGGLRVGVLTVLNALGDVFGEDGRVIAGLGARGGPFKSAVEYALERGIGVGGGLENTTVGVVITNVRGTVCDMCELAHAVNLGYGAVIRPFNTAFDGDTVFAVTTNEVDADLEVAKIAARKQAEESVLQIFHT